MNDEQVAFYDSLEMANALSYQQSHNNIMLALTQKIAESIINSDDTEKTEQLMGVLKELNEPKARP